MSHDTNAPGSGVPPQTDILAVVALTTGLLGLLLPCIPVIPSVAAIVCGHIAVSRIGSSGGKLTGKGLGIAGLCLGYLGVLVSIAVVAAMLLPALMQARNKANQAADMGNLKQLAFGAIMYTDDNKGYLPPSLAHIQPYVGDYGVFACPSRKGLPPASVEDIRTGNTDYEYLLERSVRIEQLEQAWQTPMISTKPGLLPGGGVNVAFVDGHVEWMAAGPPRVILPEPEENY